MKATAAGGTHPTGMHSSFKDPSFLETYDEESYIDLQLTISIMKKKDSPTSKNSCLMVPK